MRRVCFAFAQPTLQTDANPPCTLSLASEGDKQREINVAIHGTFIWNHLVTADQKSAGEFYCTLLGWTKTEINAGPFGTYTVFQNKGRDVAGMMNPTIDYTKSQRANWYAYVAVDDLEACVASVSKLGGAIIESPHDVPGFGRVCLIADPTGAALTLVTPLAAQH